ncbi:MAG TPA: methyltransferase domain-containing protein [Terracidiphilus sp.]|nr:methyltransferase domain-containing protein [Terracidiphilus sp.]
MLNRIFDKKPDGNPSVSGPMVQGPKIARYSGAWATLRKRLKSEPGLRVIDAGATSPTNINYLTSLGHSIFLSDPVHEAVNGNWQTGTDDDDRPIWNVPGYLNQTLQFTGRTFDVALLWTTLDYLPVSLVAPVVDHLHAAFNPGGQVLAFFHARSKAEETAYCRFHVTDSDAVEMQMGRPFQIQSTFTNRTIQELFARWSGFRQFLAKDGVYEVLITR